MQKLDTNNLIENLVADKNAKKPFVPSRLFFKWNIFSIIYLALVSQFIHIRPDIFEAIKQPSFLIELSLLVLVMIFSCFCAFKLSVPDMGNKHLIFIPLTPLILLFLFALYGAYNPDKNFVLPSFQGVECLTCIAMFSLVPAILMFLEIRKAAPTKLGFTGFFCLLYASSLAGISMRLEEIHTHEHMILWHYVPMLILSGVGALIARKALKW